MAQLTLEKLYEQADQYLSGEMPEAEQDRFEEKLQSDKAFRHLIKDYFTFKLAVRSSAREDFKAKIEQSLDESIHTTPDFSLWQKKYL
jgi:hypothetical protein